MPESASEFISEHNIICEGDFSNILSQDQIAIVEGDSIVVRFINDIINERYEQIISKGIKIHI